MLGAIDWKRLLRRGDYLQLEMTLSDCLIGEKEEERGMRERERGKE